MANRRADHDGLISYLKSLRGCVRVTFEPTEHYHRALAYRLLTEGFAVRSVSSVALARMREARYGTWDKTDPKDAQIILYMMAQGVVQTYYDPLFSGTHDIQELANPYCQITLARMRLQHSLLLHYIPLYFPEFGRYWIATRSAWFARFLLRFPTPAAVRVRTSKRLVVRRGICSGREPPKRRKLLKSTLWLVKLSAYPWRPIRPPSRCFRFSSRDTTPSTSNVRN